MSSVGRVQLLVVIALGVLAGSAGAQGQFVASLERELTPWLPGTHILCTRTVAPQNLLSELAGASVFAGSASWPTLQGELRVPLLLVEPRSAGRPFVYFDLDRDGVLSADERLSFGRARNRYGRGELRVMLPAPAGSAFQRFPVVLQLPNDEVRLPHTSDQRYLLQSVFLAVAGRVRIDGRTWFFRVGVTPDAKEVDPRNFIQAVDRGRLDDTPLSPLSGAPMGEPLVFRLGRRYVSIAEVDLARGTMLIRTREPGEYRRLELRRGLVLPDFAFRDLDGVTRRLSDFPNRYVLLFFWYHGCDPCTDEFPHLRQAKSRFASRGLTILGMSDYGALDGLRALAAPTGPFDVEATPESIDALISKWFGIFATPTLILLDPHHRIVSVNQKEGELQLRGPALLKTLDSVLPR